MAWPLALGRIFTRVRNGRFIADDAFIEEVKRQHEEPIRKNA
jgi:hypothetical protein